jgi:hypothetical protein
MDKFKSSWGLWYHHNKNNWKKNSFKLLCTIESVEEFWLVFNNWNKLGGLLNNHFFLMKTGIVPIWEDKNNINGGCWSYKKLNSDIESIWTDISVHLVSEAISNVEDDINGISITIKNNGYSVLKIWNRECSNNSLSNLNNNLLEKWGTDLIYIANVSIK